MPTRQQMRFTTAGASLEEAAAVIAAVQQFMRETAAEPVDVQTPRPSAWKRAALAEGVARRPELPFER